MTNSHHKQSSLKLMSPGAGAYRVRLVGHDNEEFAEVFLAGENASETVKLPPGAYDTYLEQVGVKVADPSPVRVVLSAAEQNMNLADSFEPVAPATQIQIEQTRATEKGQKKKERLYLQRSLRPSANQALRESGSANVDQIDTWESLHEASGSLDPSTSAILNDRNFSVGLSEDTRANERGGWRPAVNLSVIITHSSSDVLEFRIACNQEQISSRVRLTFALEGKPAVRLPVPLYKDGVLIRIRAAFSPFGPDADFEITPVNPSIAALTTSLDQLNSEEAAGVLSGFHASVDGAIQVLFEKRKDPWAAAAAALLIARMGDIERVAEWAYNLADNVASYLPDSAVAASWAYAATADGDREIADSAVLAYLVKARHRGAPCYVLANTLALELLSVLRMSGASSDIRSKAKSEHQIWARRGRRRLHTGSYLSWEAAGPDLQRGKLPTERYCVVYRGILSENGIRVDENLIS